MSPSNINRSLQVEPKSDKGNDVCSLCNSTATVFDAETSEIVCSTCGVVIHDNIESLGPEWNANFLSISRHGSIYFHIVF